MKKSILVVDDDASVRKSIATVLTSENYLTQLGRNGKEALEILANNHVDLILLDLNMPVKDGWQTFSSLSFEHPKIPIIIITARSNQLFSALAAGVAGLMEKPLDFPKLLQAIGALLSESAEARLARTAGQHSTFF